MKLRTLFELGRVSNLPTCVSNVTAGWILSGADPLTNPARWLLTTAAILCFYEAGMFLNDFFDREIDQKERPFRPIPSGRISAQQVLWVALLLIATGGAITWGSLPSAIPVAMLLVLAIFAYNLTHHFLYLSPLLMGICRGLIYLFSGYAVLDSRPGALLFLGALILTAYIAGVSTLARWELTNETSDASSVFTPLPFSIASLIDARHRLTQLRPRPATIGKLLAGMSLLDALIILPLVGIQWSLFCVLCFGATRLGHRRIAGS